jgi:TPR repeat protein
MNCGFQCSLLLLIAVGTVLQGQQSATPLVQQKSSGLYELASEGNRSALAQLTTMASHGDALSQFYVGEIYEYGEGETKNMAEAANWYRKAAEQGLATAEFNLGVMYTTKVTVFRRMLFRLSRGIESQRNRAMPWHRTTLGLCMPMVTGYRKMSFRPQLGIAKLQNKKTNGRSTTWPSPIS